MSYPTDDPMPSFDLRADNVESLAALEALRMYLLTRAQDRAAHAIWEIRQEFMGWQQRNVDKLKRVTVDGTNRVRNHTPTGGQSQEGLPHQSA